MIFRAKLDIAKLFIELERVAPTELIAYDVAIGIIQIKSAINIVIMLYLLPQTILEWLSLMYIVKR